MSVWTLTQVHNMTPAITIYSTSNLFVEPNKSIFRGRSNSTASIRHHQTETYYVYNME
jgi:hypothetical protein